MYIKLMIAYVHTFMYIYLDLQHKVVYVLQSTWILPKYLKVVSYSHPTL